MKILKKNKDLTKKNKKLISIKTGKVTKPKKDKTVLLKKKIKKTKPIEKKKLNQPKIIELQKKDIDEKGEESETEDEEVDFHIGNDNKFVEKGEESSEDEDNVNEFKTHKESLAKLKDIDPEFYKFLEENDKKLLNFNVSDSEVESDKEGDEGEDDDEDNEDKIHKPTGELEIASDESDFEPDDGGPLDDHVITLQLLKKWTSDIKTDKSTKTLLNIMKAFHAALLRVSSDADQSSAEYRVDGSSVFNAVIQLCVLELAPAIRKILKLSSDSKQPPHKCKKFVKIRTPLKGYLLDLLKLISGVTSTNIQSVLLKHLHGMCYIFVSYPAIAKKVLRHLVRLWANAEEAVRVLAFLCIVRITNGHPQKHLEPVLRNCYIAYVTNSRFVSPQTLPNINFMRRSLVELYALDPVVSYRQVFLYVRQLAIQLRAAVMTGGVKDKPKGKKDASKAVCSWQYVSSIQLWASLLGTVWNRNAAQAHLKPLSYPLIQIALGAIKTSPTVRHLPMRFHILGTLIHLSKDTKLTIPILPLLLEALEIVDVNSKHKKISMKPLDFTCILRVSKSQMQENGFKDAVVDNVYSLLLEYLSNQSNSIAFPDLTLLCIIRLKEFLKKCNAANYTRKIRALIEKIEQNSQFIEKERKRLHNVSLRDVKQIEAWETDVENKGTPLTTFYENWKKINEVKKLKQLTENDKLGEYNLPVLKKGQKPQRNKVKEGPVELFPSDSEDDDGEIEDVEKIEKKKRGKRGSKKNKRRKVGEGVEDDDDKMEDIVQDIKASDW